MGGEISRILPPTARNEESLINVSSAPLSQSMNSDALKGSEPQREGSDLVLLPTTGRTKETLGDLYVGSIQCLFNHEAVFPEHRLRCLVSCLPSDPEGLDEILQLHHIPREDFMLAPLEDSHDVYEKLLPLLPSILTFIHQRRYEGKSVLVHCDGGITRSPSVVLAYLMTYGLHIHRNDTCVRPLTLQQALSYLRQMRAKVNIRLFASELQQYEQQLNTHSTLHPGESRSRGTFAISPSPPSIASIVGGAPGPLDPMRIPSPECIIPTCHVTQTSGIPFSTTSALPSSISVAASSSFAPIPSRMKLDFLGWSSRSPPPRSPAFSQTNVNSQNAQVQSRSLNYPLASTIPRVLVTQASEMDNRDTNSLHHSLGSYPLSNSNSQLGHADELVLAVSSMDSAQNGMNTETVRHETTSVALGLSQMLLRVTPAQFTKDFLSRCKDHPRSGQTLHEALAALPRAQLEKMLHGLLVACAHEIDSEDMDSLTMLHRDLFLTADHVEVMHVILMDTLSAHYIPWNSQTQEEWNACMNMFFADFLACLKRLCNVGSMNRAQTPILALYDSDEEDGKPTNPTTVNVDELSRREEGAARGEQIIAEISDGKSQSLPLELEITQRVIPTIHPISSQYRTQRRDVKEEVEEEELVDVMQGGEMHS